MSLLPSLLTATLLAVAPASAARRCPIFPADNPINQEITHAPVAPDSAQYIASIGASLHLHADFGSNPAYGIPYVVVGPRQPKVPIKFTAYGSESNPGPYPVPLECPRRGSRGRR